MSVKRQFFSNIIGIGFIDGLNLLIPLLTIPILARVLGAEEYGVYLLITTIIMFGYTFVDYSSNYVGVRQLSQTTDSIEQGGIFLNHFFYRVLFSFLFIFIAFIVGTYIYNEQVVFLILSIGGPFLLGYAFTNTWFYIGTQSTYTLACFTVLAKVVHLIVILLYVKSPDDLSLALHSLSIPTLLSGCALLFLIFSRYKVSFVNLTTMLNNALEELKEGGNVFIGLLAPNLYNTLPLVIAAAFYSKFDYALLASAIKVASVIVIVQNILAKSVFPILSKKNKSHLKKVLIGNLFVAIAMLAALLVIGEWVITTFLGEQYKGAYNYLIVMAVSAIFIGIANTYGQGFLLANGKDKAYRNITVYCSITSGFIMFASIYFFDLLGFVIGILAARLLLAASLYAAYRREIVT